MPLVNQQKEIGLFLNLKGAHQSVSLKAQKGTKYDVHVHQVTHDLSLKKCTGILLYFSSKSCKSFRLSL